MKKIILAILLILTLVSCSDSDTWAISSGDTKLSPNTFYAQAVTYKNDFLQGYLGLTEDNALIWTQDAPSGRKESVGESIMKMVVEDLSQFVWVAEYAKDNGVTVSEEDRKNIENDFKELKNDFENEKAFLDYMTKLGVSEKELKEHLEETVYYDKGFEMLTASGGLYPITDEDLMKYFTDNFYTVKHIFFNTVISDEEGNYSEISEAEKAEKMQKAKDIISDLDSGVAFESLYFLSEDGASVDYPDGLTFTDGFTSDASYEFAVSEMEIGDYKIIEPNNGGIYVVKRMPVDTSVFDDYYEYVDSIVSQTVTEKIYDDHKDEVEVNYDIINTYDIVTMPVLG